MLSSSWFNFTKSPNKFFGRSSEIEEICKILKQKDSGLEVFSIIGAGGIGKTQLAKKFGELFFAEEIAIFTNGESPSSFKQTMISLGKKVLLHQFSPEMEKLSSFQLFRCVLEAFSKSSRWLLILDNLDEANQEVIDFFKNLYKEDFQERAFVLITSRDLQVVESFGPHYLFIKELEGSAAAELVQNSVDDASQEEPEDVRRLCERLQYFPLALQQSIAFINQQKRFEGKGFRISDFLRSFEIERGRRAVLEKKLNLSHDYESTTFVTWNISIHKIQELQHPKETALTLLQLIALCLPDSIPVTFLEKVITSIDESVEQVQESFSLLRRYSLIELESRHLSIHRLVQEVIRLHFHSQDQKVALLRKLIPAFSQILLGCGRAEEEEEEPWVRNILHAWAFIMAVDELGEEVGTLSDNLRSKLLELSMYRETVLYAKTSFENKRKRSGSVARETLVCEREYAQALQLSGRNLEAQAVFEDTLAKEKSELGEEDDETLTTAANMGGNYLGLDRKKAATQYKWVYEAYRKKYGDDNAVTMLSLGNVAGFVEEGEKALGMYRTVLEWQEKNLEEDDVNRVMTRFNVAAKLYGQAQYSQAEEIFQDILRIRERSLGPNNLETFRTIKLIALCRMKLGRSEEGRRELQELYERMKSKLGESHPDVEDVSSKMREQIRVY